jgi:CheY-like chemotaxis protein
MKIIVADDHLTNRLLVSEILKCLGHDSIEAENGQEVLDVMENSNDIDLVLMDIEMPVMGGFETMKIIREKLVFPKNAIPIIALTAHNDNIYADHYKSSGFDQTLIKPYSIDKISEILDAFKKPV